MVVMPTVAEINSFLCYKSYIDAVKVLPKEKRWDYFEKITNYAFENTFPEFTDDIEIAMFKLMQANLDSCGKRYAASVQNGKKGGRPTGKVDENKPRKKPRITQGFNLEKPGVITQKNLNENDNDNVNDNYHSPTEEGALSAPPPSGAKSDGEKFQMSGVWHEYYIAENGERRARRIE